MQIKGSNFAQTEFTVIEVNLAGDQLEPEHSIEFRLMKEFVIANYVLVVDNLLYRNKVKLIIPFDYELGSASLIVRFIENSVILIEQHYPITVIDQINAQIKTNTTIFEVNSSVSF